MAPSTYMMVHKAFSLQFQGTQHPSLASVCTRHGTSAQTYTYKLKIKQNVTIIWRVEQRASQSW